MEIAVFSDIHSNYVALEACYNSIKLRNVCGIIYLGDYVSDCPYPQKTMDLLSEMAKQYPSWFIRGNREEYLLQHHQNPDDGWKYSSQNGSLLYTYENLTNSHLEFFKQCAKTAKLELTNCLPISICHGSPLSSRESLESGSDLTNHYLKTLKTSYLLCGHTHQQFTYSSNGKTIINPGSVGIQTNNQINAQYTVLHWRSNEWAPEFVSVEYDIRKMLSDFETSGIHDKAKIWSRAVYKTLQTGKDYPLMCIELAYRLAMEKGDSIEPFGIAEEYWEEAAKQLSIV